MKNRLLFYSLFIVLLAAGCARITTRPDKKVTDRAGELLERVNAINACLTACKGTGRISFQDQRGLTSLRFAWLCSLPDKIRLEALAPTGQPLLTMAADGKYFYVLPRTGNGRLHKKKAADINLEKALHIPLAISDAVQLLAGRIPLQEFDTAERIDLPDGSYMLQLTRRRPCSTENIIFDAANARPRQIEFLRGSEKKLEYSATFSGTKIIDEATIPESIALQDDRDATVVITINRFWIESDVPVEKFVLTEAP